MLTQSSTLSVVFLCKTSGSVDSFRTLRVPSFFLQMNITFSNWSKTVWQIFIIEKALDGCPASAFLSMLYHQLDVSLGTSSHL